MLSGTIGLLMLALLLGWAIGWKLMGQVNREHSQKETSSLRSRLRYQLEKLNTFNVVENFPLGWLNIIIKYAWPGFISNLANNLTERQLRRLFENVMTRHRQNAVMKRVHKLELIEFSFGTVPPAFNTATARMTANEQALELEMNITYRSCGARLVVDTMLFIGGKEWPIRLHLDEFTLRGRLLLVFKLGWAAPPGIAGMEFSFVERPDIDFRISPVVTELPGITGQLRNALLNIIQNEAVEPARVFVDMRRAFEATVSQKQAGAAGQLRVTLSHATDLKPTSPDAVPGHKELCVAFVELRLFGKIHTTPVAPQGNSPAWGWTVCVPLQSSPVEAGGGGVLHFTVCNLASDAQPMAVGRAELDMSALSAEQLTRAEPHGVAVRLKPPRGMKGGGGRLFVTLHWDTTLLGRPAAEDAAAVGPVKTSTSPNRDLQAQASADWQDVGDEASGDERSTGGESSGEHGGGRTDGLDWAKLTQVARAEKMVNHDAVAQAQRIKELETMLFLFRKARSVEGQRALVEGAKFLLHRGWDTQLKLFWFDPTSQPATIKWEASGAIQKMTKKGSSLKQHFNSQPASLMNGIAVEETASRSQAAVAISLRVTNSVAFVFALCSHVREPVLHAFSFCLALALWRYTHRSVDDLGRHVKKTVILLRRRSQLGHIRSGLTSTATRMQGDTLFPEQKLGAVGSVMKILGKGNTTSKARESRCFSILFEDSTALHLEVPETGNGRSRNEWVDAFKVILLKRSEGELAALGP